MRLAASVVTLTLAALVLPLERTAFAREAPAVDDASATDDASGESDNEALEDEALGPRSNLRTRAEEVSFDARLRSLELAGNVRVDSPPFHLRSQRIKLTRTRYGIEIVGKGSLAFCPCLGTPLKVDFDEAIVAPPGDLILKNPTLRFYGVPILPLPYFWLRSDEKPGVLPPEIAYRGQDGLFAGGGVHLPWKSRGPRGEVEKNALELRGGAYFFRGFVADVRLRTGASATKVRYDRLPGGAGVSPGDASRDDGLLVDSRGGITTGELGIAWDADAVRGARGVASTTELDAAARRWDRVTAEGALRGGPFVVATAMRAVARRGGGLTDIEAAGPIVTARASGAAGGSITYDATVEGGSLRLAGPAASFNGAGARSPDALSFARAEAGARGTTSLGALEASLALRGAADVAAQGRVSGDDRAASARARLAVPFARRFDGPVQDRSNDPWIHVVEPFAEAAALHAKGDGLFGVSPARGASAIDGTAPLAHAGFVTSLGRWGAREALELGVSGGAAGGAQATRSGVRSLARARAAATLGWLGASADVARVFGEADARAAGRASGFGAVARVRLGPRDGLRLLANVAARDGLDPVLARALVDAPLEPAAGLLAQEGTTGGAGLVVPWSRWLTTSVGADADATHEELVAARAGIELRDRCGCLTMRLMGAHRLGREGVDVWLALDFAADR
jgi:hypothetical protein